MLCRNKKILKNSRILYSPIHRWFSEDFKRSPPIPNTFLDTSGVRPNNELVKAVESQWVEIPDPKGGSGVYWWNKTTNETTAVGEPRPPVWIEERDPAGSALTVTKQANKIHVHCYE
jgi:hypothetical protein